MINVLNHKDKNCLNEKRNEDLVILDTINNYFLKKRGYIFKLPQRGTPVLACMSGGLDSVVNILILLKECKFKVYPFFINRGQENYVLEKEAIAYFDEYFTKEFPDRYNKTFEISIEVPSSSYKNLLKETIKDDGISYPARNSIIFLTGAEYGYSLKTKEIEINTMFGSLVNGDTSFHCSLTWTRLMNLSICQMINDPNWQFTSIPIEETLGNFYDKDVLIKYAEENNFPIEHTRTCTKNTKIHCGSCPFCKYRKSSFLKAGILDKTLYEK